MNRSSGNILIYVLLAVVLFGALSFILTRQLDDDSPVGSVADGKARLRAEDLINYATSVRTAIEQMSVMQNVLPNELNFVKQGGTGYGTAPHAGKVFHPAGGGVNPYNASDEMFEAGSAKRGWVSQQGTNVAWTGSTASDVIFSFMDVATDVCKAINYRLFKDDTIPVTTINSSVMLINGGGDDGDFTLPVCPSCNQRVSFCVKDSAGVNVFYNVVLAR